MRAASGGGGGGEGEGGGGGGSDVLGTGGWGFCCLGIGGGNWLRDWWGGGGGGFGLGWGGECGGGGVWGGGEVSNLRSVGWAGGERRGWAWLSMAGMAAIWAARVWSMDGTDWARAWVARAMTRSEALNAFRIMFLCIAFDSMRGMETFRIT